MGRWARFWLVWGVVLVACSAETATPAEDRGTPGKGDSPDVDDGTRIRFDGDWEASVVGDLIVGRTVHVDYSPARVMCQGDSHGGPAWTVTMHYLLNGANGGSVTVLGHESSPGEIARGFVLPEAGDLEVWFEHTSAFGCHAWDSDFGTNYHFTVRGHGVAPDTLGNAAVVIARQTCDGSPCEADRRDASIPFRLDSWGRERAAFRAVYFDVTKAGVTDFDNGDLWKTLDVQVHYRYGGRGEFATAYVGFDARLDATARYAMDLDPFDPFSTAPWAPACPAVPFTRTEEGTARATFEYYFTVNDVPLRSANAKPFAGAFEANAAQYDTCTEH